MLQGGKCGSTQVSRKGSCHIVFLFINRLLRRPSDALLERRLDDPPQLRRSKSFLGTIKKKLRIRISVPGPLEHIAEDPVPIQTRMQSPVRKTTHRPQAVPITLSNDVTSRERREEALRARGLRPPRERRNLSAMEADEDRRIDVLQRSSTALPGPDKTGSEANDIAQLWRQSNLRWLSEDLPDLDMTASPMIKGLQLYPDAPIRPFLLFRVLSDFADRLFKPFRGQLEIPTAGACPSF